MMHDTYSSPLSERYASEAMLELWSPRTRYGLWRRLWLALAEAEKELGVPIPDTAIDYLTIAMFGAQLVLDRYASLAVARYKLPVTPASPQALLTEIGRRRGGLKPGGVVDLHKASEVFVHEFRGGKLGRISLELPP